MEREGVLDSSHDLGRHISHLLKQFESDWRACENISRFTNDKNDVQNVFRFGVCYASGMQLKLICGHSAANENWASPEAVKARVWSERIAQYDSDQICRELNETFPLIDCGRVALILGVAVEECEKHGNLGQVLRDHPEVCHTYCGPQAPGQPVTPLCKHLLFTSQILNNHLRHYLARTLSSTTERGENKVVIDPQEVQLPKSRPFQAKLDENVLEAKDESSHSIDPRKQLLGQPDKDEEVEQVEEILDKQSENVNDYEEGEESKPLPKETPEKNVEVVEEKAEADKTDPEPPAAEENTKVEAKDVRPSMPTFVDRSGYAQGQFKGFRETESQSMVLSYLVLVIIVGIIFYLVFHNKQKIFALLLEGKKSRQNRQRHRGARYHKLDNNLEEAMGSDSSGSMRHIIY
eukprot:maker-scaffold377_size191454-snap-gene-0.33 protein:Tk05673 transcript:maker-scaffold377_size191454-snap-gene-0.33-mRNA-1 annotation:"hypothetical protein LOTGIDRAFT_155518"